VKNAIPLSSYNVPVYSENSVPTIEFIESELNKALEKKAEDCQKEFRRLEYDVKNVGGGSAEVTIGEHAALASLEWPLLIDETSKLSSFGAEVDTELKSAYREAMELYNKQKTAKKQELSELANTASGKDYILHFYIRENITIYMLRFNSTINDHKLEWTFGIIPEIERSETKEVMLPYFSDATPEARADVNEKGINMEEFR